MLTNANLSEDLLFGKIKVNLTIRFQFLVRRNIDPSPIIADHIHILDYWHHNIYRKRNESSATEKLLKDWYRLKNRNKFKSHYPMRKNTKGQTKLSNSIKELAAQHSDWMENSKITSFPTYFVNNYRLPRDYDMEDMMALLPGLLDYFQPQIVNKKIQNIKA